MSCIIGVPIEILPRIEATLQRYLELSFPKIFTVLINIDLPSVHLLLPIDGMSEHLQVPFFVPAEVIGLWISEPLFQPVVVSLRISELNFV